MEKPLASTSSAHSGEAHHVLADSSLTDERIRVLKHGDTFALFDQYGDIQPSSKGARVRFSGDKRTVIDGPFTETKELIAGFWLIQVKSKDEAIAWVKRSPNPHPGTETEIEIRQVFEAEDFGPEAAAEEKQQRAQIQRSKDAAH